MKNNPSAYVGELLEDGRVQYTFVSNHGDLFHAGFVLLESYTTPEQRATLLQHDDHLALQDDPLPLARGIPAYADSYAAFQAMLEENLEANDYAYLWTKNTWLVFHKGYALTGGVSEPQELWYVFERADELLYDLVFHK